jgi:putative exosortase-associated protein (TIGR04073 family)
MIAVAVGIVDMAPDDRAEGGVVMGNAVSLAKQTVIQTSRGKSRCFRSAPALIAFVAIVVAAPCWAQAQSTSNAPTAGDKALRGLANIMTGVMAFPGEIRRNWNEGGPGMGLTVGVAKGAGMIVAYELVGVVELLTSPFPWPKDSFDPILDPAYTWNYFKD